MILEKIKSFLVNRGWIVTTQSSKFTELLPPSVLDLPEDYKIFLPNDTNKVDINAFLNNLFEIIADLYDLTIDDLDVVLKHNNTVLKVRIYDEYTEGGKISFTRFEGLIERMRNILSDTASFVIDKNMMATRIPSEVNRYLNFCNFMQTEKGSFVAKIQLPSKELIKEKELFDRNEIYSEEINQKLSEVLEFVNENIFEGEVNITEDYIIENEDKIYIKLLKNLELFYDKAEIKNIDFSFHNINNSRIISNKNVNSIKLYKLNQFVEKIESHYFEVGYFTISGKIVALKSKNPDGQKNNVVFVGIHDEIIITANANLDSEHYKHAIEAHKYNQIITITGLAKKTKTRAKFIEITEFQVE